MSGPSQIRQCARTLMNRHSQSWRATASRNGAPLLQQTKVRRVGCELPLATSPVVTLACKFLILHDMETLVCIDECTSAVSVDVERRLYKAAIDMGITSITISQRLALTEFHENELRLGELTDAGWSLHPCESGGTSSAQLLYITINTVQHCMIVLLSVYNA